MQNIEINNSSAAGWIYQIDNGLHIRISGRPVDKSVDNMPKNKFSKIDPVHRGCPILDAFDPSLRDT
jgi:hypothetical protein